MIAKLKVDGFDVTYDDGIILCDNNELRKILQNIVNDEPPQSPDKGYLPNIFEQFPNAELVSVEDESMDEVVY